MDEIIHRKSQANLKLCIQLSSWDCYDPSKKAFTSSQQVFLEYSCKFYYLIYSRNIFLISNRIGQSMHLQIDIRIYFKPCATHWNWHCLSQSQVTILHTEYNLHNSVSTQDGCDLALLLQFSKIWLTHHTDSLSTLPLRKINVNIFK